MTQRVPTGEKGLFTGCARGFLPNDEERFLKVGEDGRMKEVRSFHIPFFGSIEQSGGTIPGFRGVWAGIVFSKKRQKKAVFFKKSQILGSFLDRSEGTNAPKIPKPPKVPERGKGARGGRGEEERDPLAAKEAA
jgi:hypothetical protein